MFSSVTSQAVVLSQAKAVKAQYGGARLASRRRKRFFTRIVEALVESRIRKAELEVQYYRSMLEQGHKK